MADHYAALSDPQKVLLWVGLVSVVIGVASVLMQAVLKCPPRLGPSLAFRTAFIVMFSRIVFRLLNGGPIGYGGVVIYALPGIACGWALIDCLFRREEV